LQVPRVTGFRSSQFPSPTSPPDKEVNNGEEDDSNDGEDADDKRQARRGGRRRKERRVFGEAYRLAIWNTADQFLRRLRTVDANTRTSFVADFKTRLCLGPGETRRQGNPAKNRATRRFSESMTDPKGLAELCKSVAKKRD